MRDMLRDRRLKLGHTQQAVADGAGISRAFYTEIESGKKGCSIDTWIAIGIFLKIPESELVPYITNKKGA